MAADAWTARGAKALQAGGHLIVAEAPGLRMVATASTRTWVYRYKSPTDGRMRQVRLGRWPGMGLPQAMLAWERARAERQAGTDVAAQRRQARRAAAQQATGAVYTVRRMADDWLQAWGPTVAPKTMREAERQLRQEIGAIERVPAAQLKRDQVYDLLWALQLRAPVVAAALRQTMGAVTDRAIDAGRVPSETPNWWRLVLRGRLVSRGKITGGLHAGQPVKRALLPSELQALLPWWGNWSREAGDALALVLWTGCRGAEVCALRAEYVTDEADGWWLTIPRDQLKMRRNPLLTDLRVPLVGRARQIIERRLPLAGDGWLWPSWGASGHIEQKALGVAVWHHRPECTSQPKVIRARTPVTGWAPHDLRRTCRTHLAALGCPSEIAEQILGHMLPGIQAVYDRHHYDAERRHWLTRWDARLRELAGEATADPAG